MRFAPFESWGCYLQVDLCPGARSRAASQSPAFEFPIHAADNAVAIGSFQRLGGLRFCFCCFPS